MLVCERWLSNDFLISHGYEPLPPCSCPDCPPHPRHASTTGDDMTEMPHPDAMAAGFRFARLIANPDFRAYLLAGRCRGVPVVATHAGEDRAALRARVQAVGADYGTPQALIVAVDESQPWGLRIQLVPTPPTTAEPS